MLLLLAYSYLKQEGGCVFKKLKLVWPGMKSLKTFREDSDKQFHSSPHPLYLSLIFTLSLPCFLSLRYCLLPLNFQWSLKLDFFCHLASAQRSEPHILVKVNFQTESLSYLPPLYVNWLKPHKRNYCVVLSNSYHCYLIVERITLSLVGQK